MCRYLRTYDIRTRIYIEREINAEGERETDILLHGRWETTRVRAQIYYDLHPPGTDRDRTRNKDVLQVSAYFTTL